MRKNVSFMDSYAVSEVIGAILLIVIAVIVFSIIYLNTFPLDIPPAEHNVKLVGYVTESGYITIEHIGGEALFNYKIEIRNLDGTLVNSDSHENLEDPWTIGEAILPDIETPLLTENQKLHVIVYSKNSAGDQTTLFDGILIGKIRIVPLGPYMLVSSLFTNTIDEDLICFNYTIDADINVSTYIYNWVVNDESFAEILMPFNSENASYTKDYSGNDNNGTVISATWTDNGVVGGAYHFSGASDYIAFDLPSAFEDISNNDFSILLWINSDDISDDWRVVMEARKDNKNFVKIFQFGNEIHFGVCDDGVKSALRTENLTSGTWYHIVGTWDASEKSLSLYCNGVNCTEIGNRNYPFGAHEGLHLGHGTASSRFWLGYIDEFESFDHVLSPEQANQVFQCTKDGFSDKRVIVSKETRIGDIWQCIVTPNDGTQDDTPVWSNILEITNYGGGE